MDVLSFETDTDEGFAWIIVPQKNGEGTWTIQCCLNNNGEIICDDCGANEGICGDNNEAPFDYWGENRCMTALFKHARSAGISVIGL